MMLWSRWMVRCQQVWKMNIFCFPEKMNCKLLPCMCIGFRLNVCLNNLSLRERIGKAVNMLCFLCMFVSFCICQHLFLTVRELYVLYSFIRSNQVEAIFPFVSDIWLVCAVCYWRDNGRLDLGLWVMDTQWMKSAEVIQSFHVRAHCAQQIQIYYIIITSVCEILVIILFFTVGIIAVTDNYILSLV